MSLADTLCVASMVIINTSIVTGHVFSPYLKSCTTDILLPTRQERGTGSVLFIPARSFPLRSGGALSTTSNSKE